MSLMTVYSDGGADYPDEAKWIPGELGEREQLHDDESLNIQLERSLVYPNGVLVTVTVRALVPPDSGSTAFFQCWCGLVP